MKIKKIIKKTVNYLPRRVRDTVYTLYSNRVYQRRIKEVAKTIPTYQALNTRETMKYEKVYEWLINDSYEKGGSLDCYYWQDLWAATKVLERRPELHYDIGSRVDGFIAHLQASRQKTCLLDIRPIEDIMPYVSFQQTDATNLAGIPDESIDSISALCSLEHFGLGRYGDAVDPEAWFKAMKSIQRVLKRGGYAYIAVPVGKEHVEFNAHRIFYPETIIDTFDLMECTEFKVTSSPSGEGAINIESVDNIHKFDNEFLFKRPRFGLFEFVKK